MNARRAWTAGGILLVLAGLHPGNDALANGLQGASQPIVNGVLTSEGIGLALLKIGNVPSSATTCTGTLIGCRTVLTAAGCFCQANGAGCNLDPGAPTTLFLQHGGVFSAAEVFVHPNFNPATLNHNLALVRLSEEVEGLPPHEINTKGTPPPGSLGSIFGFGETEGGRGDTGLLRGGVVTTAPCMAGSPPNHVCWDFQTPLGSPGSNSNTCHGDDGGPLFVLESSGNSVGIVVAGVTDYGVNSSCLPQDHSGNADVYVDRAWILQQGGADLDRTTCGDLPPAGSIMDLGVGTLSHQGEDTTFFEIPEGVALLRVAINGEDAFGENDFDLEVGRAGGSAVCSGNSSFNFEVCDIEDPDSSGPWFARARSFSGSGQYQLTVTTFGQGGGGPGACVADSTTMCLAGGRFRVETLWSTPNASGSGQAVQLTPDTGYFWFFDQANVEMVVKVLDACSFSDRFWVFAGGLTNVEVDLIVTDTLTGDRSLYFNPPRTPFRPIQDTDAFATCP